MKLLRSREETRDLLILILPALAVLAAAWAGWLPWSAAAVVLTLYFIIRHLGSVRRRHGRMTRLTGEIAAVLHGETGLGISDYEEGELSILRSEIQKMSQRLLEQKDRLQADKVYLSDSLADISHQIRTPLTSLHLITDRLLSEGRSGDRQLLREQRAHLDQIDWLIAGLLKLAKLDAGTVSMQQVPVALRDLVEKALEPLAIPLELKDIQVAVSVSPDALFTGDLAWSAEAVANILKNCMEHTPPGGRLTIRGEANPLYAALTVEDSGVGIHPEDLPHLFERFYRGRSAGDQSVGIGLALARLIISRQGGTLKAENRRGGGARFVIRFYPTA